MIAKVTHKAYLALALFVGSLGVGAGFITAPTSVAACPEDYCDNGQICRPKPGAQSLCDSDVPSGCHTDPCP